MNNLINRILRRGQMPGLLCLLALSFAPAARAGLTFDLRLIRDQQGASYNFYAETYTNSTLPTAALGNYLIASPQQPTNGTWRQFEMTTNGFNFTGGGSSSYSDFAAVMQQITNGYWTILFTNATTTNHFRFTVSAPNMTSNMLPALVVTSPTEGATLPTPQPTFAWQWPDGWGVNSDAFVLTNNSIFQYASLPEAQHTWFMATPLPVGENLHLQLRYTTNYATPLFVATTPLNTNSAQPISGWVSASGLTSIENVDFAVTNTVSSGGAHTLVAHFAFDDSTSIFSLGLDSSPNGNNMVTYGNWGPVHTNSADAMAGGTAVQFFGTSGMICLDQVLTNLNAVLVGSFTFSTWVKTTASTGNDTDDAESGATMFWAYNDHNNTNDTIPLAITGSKASFTTRDHLGNFNTLHSGTSVNDGNYHLLTVTRDQSTGEKKIYVDGNFEASEVGTTEPLNGNNYYLSIGGTTISSYTGLLDDLQIYSGVLSASEVAYLHTNPGSTVLNIVAAPSSAHKNIGHYTFDNSGYLGQDFSGRGYGINCGSGWGPSGSPGHQFSTTAIAGGGAIQFYGFSSLCVVPSMPVYTNWLATLDGSFSFSAWVKTTAARGNDNDDAISGATIVWACNDHGNTNDTIPLAITGGKAAFSTRNHLGVSTTLHSTSLVTNGAYHHLAVTRNVTGEKKIYVDGNLEGTEIGTTDPLNGNDYYLSIGGSIPSSYVGLLDEVQVYSGVLSSFDIAYLYQHPGSNVLDTTDQDFNAALNTAGLPWTTSGDSDWFVVSTNTHDNVSAARSGSVTNNQTSTLSVTVTGPGTLTFYWSTIADDPNFGFDYEFDLDNGYMDEIYGNTFWYQNGPFIIPTGQHTLSWKVSAYGDTDPTQAGFLDQVSFVANSPVALLNPQTTGTNFQFQFLSQSGFTHAIQYRTNLVAGLNWQTYSNVTGDGTLKTIPIPLSVFNPVKQGFVRILTQ